MKDKKYKKIIIINSIISLILISGVVSISIFILNLNTITSGKIRKINSEISQINNENIKNNQKLIDVIKYEKNWNNLSNRSKSTENIKPNEVNQIVTDISNKYHIKDIQFELKVPTKLKSGIFKKDSIEVFLASGNIIFGASDDIKALRFIKDLFLSLPGNVIIESISLSKSRDYIDKDYVAISQNGNLSKIKTRITFHWYSKKAMEAKDIN